MNDYYSVLNIVADAAIAEIKKAYFSLVRKFPPDRHPEEFMKIREAYEVLVDENTRRQYDEVNAMPGVVKLYFNEARKALEIGDAPEAIRYLEQVTKVHPNFSVVNILLGDAYLHNDNSGKAIQIFEKLATREQSNAGIARRLAHAYAARGWHKKAMEQYRRALSLDEDNLSLWLGLIECHMAASDLTSAKKTAWDGLAVSKKKGWDNLELYYHIIHLDIYSQDHENLKIHLDEMKRKAAGQEDERENMAWFLANLAKKIHGIGLYEESAATIEAAFLLLPGDKELEKIKNEIELQFTVYIELERFREGPYSNELIADMIDFELNQCRNPQCLDCNIMRLAMEMKMIMEIADYRKEVSRLKSAYPRLYELKKEFFDNILNRNKEDFLFASYDKKYRKYKKLVPEKFELDEEEEDDIVETYTRPQPKIGRNEPCPCGSGKKYKKCCGK